MKNVAAARSPEQHPAYIDGRTKCSQCGSHLNSSETSSKTKLCSWCRGTRDIQGYIRTKVWGCEG